MKKVVAAYARVSSFDQNLEGQQAEIAKWLSGNGIDAANVKWFVDKKSGKSLDRPAFDELQAAIFRGEVGTVVVYKIDRLSRSLRDGINVLCDWTEKGIRVVAVTQQIDLNGTVGKMIASVLLAVAQMELEYMRERQAAGIVEARKKGRYKTVGRKKGSTKAPNPDRALKLQQKGLTADEIATAMGISRASVFVFLRAAKAKRQTV